MHRTLTKGMIPIMRRLIFMIHKEGKTHAYEGERDNGDLEYLLTYNSTYKNYSFFHHGNFVCKFDKSFTSFIDVLVDIYDEGGNQEIKEYTKAIWEGLK